LGISFFEFLNLIIITARVYKLRLTEELPFLFILFLLKIQGCKLKWNITLKFLYLVF